MECPSPQITKFGWTHAGRTDGHIPGICLARLYQVCHLVELDVPADELHGPGRGIIGDHRAEPRHLESKADGPEPRGGQPFQNPEAFLMEETEVSANLKGAGGVGGDCFSH